MYDTIFLHIASVLKNNSAPITTQGCAWSYITVFPNNHIACHSRLRVHEGRRMNDGYKAFECIDHGCPKLPCKLKQPAYWAGCFRKKEKSVELYGQHLWINRALFFKRQFRRFLLAKLPLYPAFESET